MRRFAHLLALAAATLVGGTVIAGTAHAQNAASAPPTGYYVAVPVATPAKQTLITRSTPWDLRGNAYVAKRSIERPALLCDMVARRAGALSSFTVDGQAYDADALAKCNARAKPTGRAVADVAAR